MAVNADGTRFYGGAGTIHQTDQLDIETRDGKVVAVWFRCATLPFRQVEIDERREREMSPYFASPMVGVTFQSEPKP